MKKTFPPSLLSLRQLLVAALLGISLAGLSGCIVAAAGAGAGAMAYAGRELETTLPNDYSKVVRATQNAVQRLEFTKVSEQKDALKAVLVSRTGLDKKVEITITNSGNKTTHISIIVGLIGDKELSVAILDKIKAEL
jgi:hypothetical protein